MEYKFKITVVICTYNRCKYLPEALESIRLQSLSRFLFQLIVVDNNSTDNTSSISKTFIEKNPDINVKYCFEHQKGLSFARNRGVKEAESPIISFVDDDAILSPAFLEKMLDFFIANNDAVGVGGKVIPKYASGKEPIWMSKYLNGFVGKVDYGNETCIYNENMKYPAGCNMTYTKEILLKAGGFNNELTFRSDDKYIFFKIKNFSRNIWYLPDAWVYHYIDDERLSMQNFKKLFLKTGNEEKIRIRAEGGNFSLFKKSIEFIFKLFASIALYFLFLMKGQVSKGKYIAISQWYTLKGFLQKKVFVR